MIIDLRKALTEHNSGKKVSLWNKKSHQYKKNEKLLESADVFVPDIDLRFNIPDICMIQIHPQSIVNYSACSSSFTSPSFCGRCRMHTVAPESATDGYVFYVIPL